MSRLPEPPSITWRWLGLVAVGTLLFISLGIVLISSGVFDPRPLGTRRVLLPVPPVSENNGTSPLWLVAKPAGDTYSIRLTARAQALESRYGLAVGSPEAYIAAAVSPRGYLALWEHHDIEQVALPNALSPTAWADPLYVLPWQTWPHIRLEDQPNEWWFDVRDGALVGVRLNRELLWEGTMPVATDLVGLWWDGPEGKEMVEGATVELFE